MRIPWPIGCQALAPFPIVLEFVIVLDHFPLKLFARVLLAVVLVLDLLLGAGAGSCWCCYANLIAYPRIEKGIKQAVRVLTAQASEGLGKCQAEAQGLQCRRPSEPLRTLLPDVDPQRKIETILMQTLPL
jgi:hypothetical protein